MTDKPASVLADIPAMAEFLVARIDELDWCDFDEFMANIVLPGGETVGEWMRPQIAEAYRIGVAPNLLPMLPAPPSPDTPA